MPLNTPTPPPRRPLGAAVVGLARHAGTTPSRSLEFHEESPSRQCPPEKTNVLRPLDPLGVTLRAKRSPPRAVESAKAESRELPPEPQPFSALQWLVVTHARKRPVLLDVNLRAVAVWGLNAITETVGAVAVTCTLLDVAMALTRTRKVPTRAVGRCARGPLAVPLFQGSPAVRRRNPTRIGARSASQRRQRDNDTSQRHRASFQALHGESSAVIMALTATHLREHDGAAREGQWSI